MASSRPGRPSHNATHSSATTSSDPCITPIISLVGLANPTVEVRADHPLRRSSTSALMTGRLEPARFKSALTGELAAVLFPSAGIGEILPRNAGTVGTGGVISQCSPQRAARGRRTGLHNDAGGLTKWGDSASISFSGPGLLWYSRECRCRFSAHRTELMLGSSPAARDESLGRSAASACQPDVIDKGAVLFQRYLKVLLARLCRRRLNSFGVDSLTVASGVELPKASVEVLPRPCYRMDLPVKKSATVAVMLLWRGWAGSPFVLVFFKAIQVSVGPVCRMNLAAFDS